MPDIWTRYPEVVRRILEEAGFRCGVEPQILPRSASETCQLVKGNFLGEIYIHEYSLLDNTILILAFGIAIVIIVVLALMLVKKSKKKK